MNTFNLNVPPFFNFKVVCQSTLKVPWYHKKETEILKTAIRTSGPPKIFLQKHSAQWSIHGRFLYVRMITYDTPVHHSARDAEK